MATTTSSVGFSFNVSDVRHILTPRPHATFMGLDEHGLLLALERLRSERNELYRQRLLEVISRRANASYQGLINGITRELGYSLYKSMWINPVLDTDGTFLAPDPYIKFDGVWLYLYSDYQNDVLDAQLDRHEPGGQFEHLWRLVGRVNQSPYFQAGLHPGVDLWTRSMTIFNQSNRKQVEIEAVQGSRKFQLEKRPVCLNTVFFSDRSVYAKEVDTAAEVTQEGRYHIDYHNGYVTSYSSPLTGTSVQYRYHEFPFVAWASPVILHNINDDNFKVKMFEQVLQDDGTYAHGATTAVGRDIINELLTYHPMYWGQ